MCLLLGGCGGLQQACHVQGSSSASMLGTRAGHTDAQHRTAAHTRLACWALAIRRDLCRWAVGVLIFEMVAGHPPFYDEDRVRMFKNICSVKYSCPPHFSKVHARARLPASRRHAL